RLNVVDLKGLQVLAVEQDKTRVVVLGQRRDVHLESAAAANFSTLGKPTHIELPIRKNVDPRKNDPVRRLGLKYEMRRPLALEIGEFAEVKEPVVELPRRHDANAPFPETCLGFLG